MTLRLTEMTCAERLAFAAFHVEDYAAARVADGDWTAAEAPQRSRDATAPLFTGGTALLGHTLLIAKTDDDSAVGQFWIAPPPKFLADVPGTFRWINLIHVDPAHRNRGHGLAMLNLLHARLAAEGIDAVWLRVHDTNAVARRLYARAGYEVMRKHATDAHLRRTLRD